MSPKTRDLFDDSRMSFGEHLEELRYRVILALIGLTIGTSLSLTFGEQLVGIIRSPIDKALVRYGYGKYLNDTQKPFDPWTYFWGSTEEQKTQPPVIEGESKQDGQAQSVDGVSPDSVTVDGATSGSVEKPLPESLAKLEGKNLDLRIRKQDLAELLHQISPETFPKPTAGQFGDSVIGLQVEAREFEMWRELASNGMKPVTFNVQEAFMTYLKVSLAAGFLISSPWIFYQLWMFIAVGLYEHERKYLYIYGTLSLVLFLAGTLFCFFLVFPLVLDFFLSFNTTLEVLPMIRLSDWITFALLLPIMFGISFELPVVMLALERMGIFESKAYRENRKMSILVIAFLSMILTPSEPYSMLLMMIPLVLLYEFGIYICEMGKPKVPEEGNLIAQ
jgi:sec-independent protein translocase protein TatC